MNALKLTDEQLYELGLEALVDKLGTAGMIRFIHLFDTGTGDYTKDRHQWLANGKRLDNLQQPTDESDVNR